jgi:AhpD family alkylhydroperoxidase
MQTITVYDPPMCWSTGVCGPEVDPKLAQFAGDLDWLKARGVSVERINLAQEPGRFVENAAVKAILDRSGGDDLPAIIVGNTLVANGRYPGREELASFVGLSPKPTPLDLSEQVRELIALGATIGASCEPYFKFHYDKARKLGVTPEAMREAIRIGEAVKAASAKNVLGLAEKLIGSTEPKASPGGCCSSARTADQKSSGCC